VPEIEQEIEQESEQESSSGTEQETVPRIKQKIDQKIEQESESEFKEEEIQSQSERLSDQEGEDPKQETEREITTRTKIDQDNEESESETTEESQQKSTSETEEPCNYIRNIVQKFVRNVQDGDLPSVKQDLESCPELLNEGIHNGYSAIGVAAGYKQWKIVEHLLQQEKINVNKRPKDGYTPLMLAAHVGDIEILNALLAFDPTDDRDDEAELDVTAVADFAAEKLRRIFPLQIFREIKGTFANSPLQKGTALHFAMLALGDENPCWACVEALENDDPGLKVKTDGYGRTPRELLQDLKVVRPEETILTEQTSIGAGSFLRAAWEIYLSDGPLEMHKKAREHLFDKYPTKWQGWYKDFKESEQGLQGMEWAVSQRGKPVFLRISTPQTVSNVNVRSTKADLRGRIFEQLSGSWKDADRFWRMIDMIEEEVPRDQCKKAMAALGVFSPDEIRHRLDAYFKDKEANSWTPEAENFLPKAEKFLIRAKEEQQLEEESEQSKRMIIGDDLKVNCDNWKMFVQIDRQAEDAEEDPEFFSANEWEWFTDYMQVGVAEEREFCAEKCVVETTYPEQGFGIVGGLTGDYGAHKNICKNVSGYHVEIAIVSCNRIQRSRAFLRSQHGH